MLRCTAPMAIAWHGYRLVAYGFRTRFGQGGQGGQGQGPARSSASFTIKKTWEFLGFSMTWDDDIHGIFMGYSDYFGMLFHLRWRVWFDACAVDVDEKSQASAARPAAPLPSGYGCRKRRKRRLGVDRIHRGQKCGDHGWGSFIPAMKMVMTWGSWVNTTSVA